MIPPENLQSESDHAVRVEGARFGFEGALLFDGLELALERGRWTCLLGPSGVGKSSLLRVIAGLERLEAGSLSVLGGASVAYMAQQDLLMPWLSALGNVSLGARLRGEKPDRERALAMLERVGLGARYMADARLPGSGPREYAAGWNGTTSLDAIRVHGARGYVSEFEVERDLRDGVGGLSYSGTSDIQRAIIAGLLGL